MKNKLLIISFLLTLCLQAQTPCVGGFADIYPCNDYDLMAHIPVSTLANTLGNPEGSDIWGWTDPQTGKEYALAAMTNSTAFVDITDPINPIFLGRLDTANGNTSFWRDVKVYQDHAFIVADNVNAHGMQVFDLTRLRGVTSPQTFTADTTYGAVSSCHNIVINEAKGVAYLVDCKNDGRGIHFVDISDPKTPFNIGNYNLDGVTHDAQVVTYSGPDTDYTNQEILIGSNETKIIILDVTDTSNVVKISEIDYPQLGYTHQGWLTEDQKYFLLGDETDEQNFGFNTRTLIFDFSDLDNPSLKSTYTGPTPAIDHNGYVKGNFFYLANYRAGLRILDLTNIDLTINPMTEVGFFDTYPSNDGTGFNGAWSVYPYFASQNIIINDIESGLFIVRKSGLPLSVANETFNDRFSIFPNPANTNPVIKAKENELIQSVAVYNILGREIFSQDTINRSEFVLPVENQSKGIYIVKINQTLSKKLVLR